MAHTKPNIIIIMANDLGIGDLEPYGQSIIKTPKLRQLAEEGLMFLRAYSGGAVCAPSRGTLFTGKHTGHAYIRASDPSDSIPVGDGLPLRKNDTTLAQMLKTAGYKTGIIGLWGLGVQNTSGSPDKKGFDMFFGYLNRVHAGNYFTDSLWRVKDGKLFPERISNAAYTPDLFLYEAKKFIREHKSTPFFLFYSSPLPSAELLIPKKYMKQYTDKSGQSKFLETPYDGEGRFHKQDMPKAAYASMVSKLDEEVGSLVDLLKELDMDKNTLILFTSDNGVHTEGGHDPTFFNSTAGLRGIKNDVYEGGIRSPMIAWWPGKIPESSKCSQIVAFWDFMPMLAALARPKYVPKNDGYSFLPVLLNPDSPMPNRGLYWENYLSNKKQFTQAYLEQNWKLIKKYLREAPATVELYDLNTDPFENRNLAEQNVSKTQELLRKMHDCSTKPEHQSQVYWKDLEKGLEK